MKNLLLSLLFASAAITMNAQCHFIPSTSTATDTLSYTFSGGSFESYGCAPIDPTYWIFGSGISVTVTFVNPEPYPTFMVWGMNDDDVASVSVDGTAYPLTASSASYDAKVVCGLSPGPDGVIFLGGNLTGANSPADGNYSYQNVQLNVPAVNSFMVTGISGAGWGFAGVSVDCPFQGTGIYSDVTHGETAIYPNPFQNSTLIELPTSLLDGEISVYNYSGQKIKTLQHISGDRIIFNANELTEGFYFILITENDKIISSGKLMVAS